MSRSQPSEILKKKTDRRVAGVSRRFGAYLIDFLLLIIPVGFMGSLFLELSRSQALLFTLAICLEQYLYFFSLTWLTKGQTLGQKIFKIRVIALKGTSSSTIIKASLIHSIGKIMYLLPLDLLIGWIVSHYRLKKELSRYTQMVAQTLVIFS